MNLPDVKVVRFTNGQTRKAAGLQVGVLFVRPAFSDEVGGAPNSTELDVKLAGLWVIELDDFGINVYRSFAAALLVADEIMRWCEDLASARSFEEVHAAMLGPIAHWLQYTAICDAANKMPTDYRTWRNS